MITIDKNRINFCELNIDERAAAAGLLKPLTDISDKTAADYKNVPVDVNSPANAEALVNVTQYGVKSVPYYAEQAKECPTYRKTIWGAPYINYARSGVAQKLVKANEILDQLGLELVVVDAHRSPRTQNILFKAFVAKAEEKGLKGEDAIKDALTFCSRADKFNPEDPKTWSIHSTGGAVDCYLLDKKTQRVVDLGEQHFDRAEKETFMDYYERLSEKQPLTREQQGFLNARRVLSNVMTSLDFVIYGAECWHFSYGDLYWGLVKEKTAIYGYKQSPRDANTDMIRRESKRLGSLELAIEHINRAKLGRR